MSNLECISVVISSHLIISCIYLPPTADDSYHMSLLDFLYNLSPSHDHIIMGDFNMPDIDWFTLTARTTHSNSFCDAVYVNNLYHLISVPTHIKGNTLDLLLTNVPDKVTNVHINSSSPPEFDHFIISLSYALNIHFSHPRSPHSFNTLNYSQADWVGLNDYLCDIDFNTCFDPLNIDNSWDALL